MEFCHCIAVAPYVLPLHEHLQATKRVKFITAEIQINAKSYTTKFCLCWRALLVTSIDVESSEMAHFISMYRKQYFNIQTTARSNSNKVHFAHKS
jgi:hypothetical protein